MFPRLSHLLRWALVAVIAAAPALAQQAAKPWTGACAKIWVDREAEMEQYLKTAKIKEMKDIDLGITHPRHAYLEPGGPFESMAWKPLRPGIYDGHWESYKSEIAAYELDKVLQLHMVPPTVERKIDGEDGAAIMWVAPVTMWRDTKKETRPTGNNWAFQIIRQHMFDDLIGNDDDNQGNQLIDGDGHMCLIDHSRAFATSSTLPLPLEKIDAMLWGRMAALTEESLTSALGPWLDGRQIREILARRDRMKQEIDKLVAANGAAKVFVAGGPRD